MCEDVSSDSEADIEPEDTDGECWYLPKKFNGVPVLIESEGGMWRATNEHLMLPNLVGLGYRASKTLDDRVGDSYLAWGSCVCGVDDNSLWVRIPKKDSERKQQRL